MFVIRKNKPEADIPRTIRFTDGLFEELNKAAAAHEVSFNSLVLQCCRYSLDKMEKKADIPDASV